MSISIQNPYGSYAANYAFNSYAAETADNSKSTSKSTTSETKQYSNANEYAKYLSEKYAYFGKTASVYGVPTTITVSSAYLQKCANDPEEAKVLERNLAAVPECTIQGEARLQSAPGSPVTTYRNVVIDENGHISSISGCTNDPTGRIARENAARKAREAREARRDAEEAAARKRAEKRKAERRMEQERLRAGAENTRTLLFHGRDAASLTNAMMRSLLTNGFEHGFGFDFQA